MSLKDDAGTIAGIIGAITSLLAVMFGFIIKNKKSTIKHVETSWEELIQDSAEFRDEIRKDLQTVKQERDRLKDSLKKLEDRLENVIQENLELKMKEIELTHRIKDIKTKCISDC